MRPLRSAVSAAFASWSVALLVATSLFAGLSAAQQTTQDGRGIGGARKLFTSSVAYCSPPIAILVTDLDLTFYPGNSTLEFEISAASTQDNLNVSVALSVNAYGIGVFNVDLNLCDFAAGILCPLPKYQFSGGGIFPVPEQIGEQVPGIAYRIPNLEAVATVQLTDNSNNNVVGCVQATLSNGHTARQSGAKWATVGLALLALFSSILHTSIAQSIGAAQWRIVDVMLAIQQPAITALLSLNYPIVYLEYGTNFAWSLGLVDIPSLQSSITQTRYSAGGTGTAVFGKNLTAETGRQYNPFGSGSGSSISSTGRSVSPGSLGINGLFTSTEEATSTSVFSSLRNSLATTQFRSLRSATSSLARRAQYAPNTGPGGSLNTGGSGETLPLVTGNATVDGGIGMFAERNDIAPDNVFLTSLVSMMILLAIVVGALLVLYVVALAARLFFMRKYRYGGLSTFGHWGRRVSEPGTFLSTIALATLFRFLLIITPVYLIFAFWQWYAGDSWPGKLVAALLFVVLLVALAGFFVPLFLNVRRSSVDTLYFDEVAPLNGSKAAKRWGHISHPFRHRFFWFSLAFLAWWFVRACFISFAQGHGTRQAIGLLVTEVLLFVVLCIFRIGRDKKSDFVFIFMCFARIAAWAVCVVFIPAANIRTIPRAIVAYVLLVVTAIPIIYLFFVTVLDLISPLLRRKRRDIDHIDRTLEPEKEKNTEHGQELNNDPSNEASSEHPESAAGADVSTTESREYA